MTAYISPRKHIDAISESIKHEGRLRGIEFRKEVASYCVQSLEQRMSIMYPILKTTKQYFSIPSSYDNFCNLFSPFAAESPKYLKR